MSLENRCLNSLAESILKMPDLMREKVSNVCEQKIIKIEKQKAEQKAIKSMVNIAVIVSDIFEDMIKAMENTHYYRKDYYKMYSKIDKDVIDIAVKNAEILLEKFANTIIIGKKELEKFRSYDSDYNDVYTSNRDEDDYNISEDDQDISGYD